MEGRGPRTFHSLGVIPRRVEPEAHAFGFPQLRGSFVAHAVGKGTCPGRNRTPPALGVGIHHRGPALDLAFGDATAPVDKAR